MGRLTYFVIVTVATVGCGDINLLNASATSKLIAVALILGSTFFIWMIFSLTIDRIIQSGCNCACRQIHARASRGLGGLGRLGYFIAEALLDAETADYRAEQNIPPRSSISAAGARRCIGDARALGVLGRAFPKQKALFAVISSDYVNLEIGLNARRSSPICGSCCESSTIRWRR